MDKKYLIKALRGKNLLFSLKYNFTSLIIISPDSSYKTGQPIIEYVTELPLYNGLAYFGDKNYPLYRIFTLKNRFHLVWISIYIYMHMYKNQVKVCQDRLTKLFLSGI